jgi:hypothetical protein
VIPSEDPRLDQTTKNIDHNAILCLPVVLALAGYQVVASIRMDPPKSMEASPDGLEVSAPRWKQIKTGRYNACFSRSRATPSNDPQGTPGASNKIYRGGDYGSSPPNVRSARRIYGTPGYRGANVSFRLARFQSVRWAHGEWAIGERSR